MPARPFPDTIGGQAVLEGVMMRAPRSMAVAVRKRDGSILVRETPWEPVWSSFRFLRWPFLRGAVNLVESLWNGMQALSFSAEQAELDDPSTSLGTGPATSSGTGSDSDVRAKKEPQPPLSKAALAGTIVVALLLGFALFAALPRFLTWGLGLAVGSADLESGTKLLFNAVNGVFKLTIFLGYLWGISRMKDIRRVFQFHGAEHKSVFAYEARARLDVPGAQAFTTFHPRCGTSFLLLVVAVSIVVFSVTLPFLPRLAENSVLNQALLVLIDLPMMFPIAGVAYELIRLSGKRPDHPVVKAIAAPGLWLQRITTQPPDDGQVEVALAAMLTALAREVGGEPIPAGGHTFALRSLSDLALPADLAERAAP
jgi:uncharacterized protein YqhQ